MTDSLIIEAIINGDSNPIYKHYDRIKEISEFCRMITTGEGQEETVTSLRLSETDMQKKQRVRIYKTMTKYITSKVFRYMNMLRNIDDVKKRIEHPNASFLEKIDKQIKGFGGDYNLDDYLFQRCKYYEEVDPNALLIVEFEDELQIDGTLKRKVYPFEVKSENICSLVKEKGEIKEVVVRHAKKMPIKGNDNKDKTIDVFDFYLYAKGYTIIYERVEKQLIEEEGNQNFVSYFTKFSNDGNREKKEVYKIYFYKRPEMTMVMQWGKRLDSVTDNETLVSILDPARPQLEEIIYAKSELDLSVWLHVFQRVLMAGFPCKHVHDGNSCEGGQINGAECPSCHGHGVVYPTTSQDITHVALPEGLQNIPNLSNLIQYVSPPDSVPRLVMERITDILGQISNAIFDENIFAVGGLLVNPQKTATESIIDYSKLYNVFAEDTAHYSMMYEKIVTIIAAYMSDGTSSESLDELIVVHRFPKDFKFNTLDELISKYQIVKNAGLGFEILKAIKKQIIQKLYPDDKIEAQKTMARMDWQPFADKSEQEIQTILSNRTDTDFQKVLYDNFKDIFDDIEHEFYDPQFFEMNYAEQKKVVAQKVQQYIESVQLLTDATNQNDFFQIDATS
jgi:hypothetical protein